jgi:hypothetical protein
MVRLGRRAMMRARDGDYRLPPLPFVVVYRIREDIVEIANVIHAAQEMAAKGLREAESSLCPPCSSLCVLCVESLSLLFLLAVSYRLLRSQASDLRNAKEAAARRRCT